MEDCKPYDGVIFVDFFFHFRLKCIAHFKGSINQTNLNLSNEISKSQLFLTN